MKKTSTKAISLFLALSVLQPAYGIELNTKVKNTDRSIFNTNPGVDIKEGRGLIFGEYNFSSNPMIIRNKTTGAFSPLVNNIMGLDLGMNYGLTDWFQVGLLLPFEMPSGANSVKYLNGPYLETKFKLSDHFALVPFYQLGISQNVKINLNGNEEKVPMGSPKGMYGAKLVSQWGNILKDWGLATQVGFSSSPDNKYDNIDQASRILLGASLGAPFTKDLIGVLELNIEKYNSRTPAEILGIVNYLQDDYNLQVGMGSGNLQGSGSNSFKMFVGISMFFGGPQRPNINLVPRKNKVNIKSIENNNQRYQPLYEGSYDDEMDGPAVLEPEESVAPSIPDVNNEKIENFVGRNIASIDDLEEEIMNSIIETTEQVKEDTIYDPLLLVLDPTKKTKTKSVLEQAQEKTRSVLRKKLELDSTSIADTKKVEPVQIQLVEPEAIKDIKKTIAVKAEVEASKVKKEENTKKMATLPNGQKVKVFSLHIDEMPSEMGIIYMTEKEFNKKTQEMKLAQAEGKKLTKPLEPKVLSLITPAKFTEVEEEKVVEATPITVENFVEIKEAKVVREKEKDPIVMIPEHLDGVQAQGDDLPIIAVDVFSLGKKKEIAPVTLQVGEIKEDKVSTASVALESDLSADTVDLNLLEKELATPPVVLTVESREEMKEKLSKEFSTISLETSRQDLSSKVLEEQSKINQEMTRIKDQELADKKALEDKIKADELAKIEKDLRENYPLAENAEQGGKAATEAELKSVIISNRNNSRPIIVSLPQARLNAYAAGSPLPKLQANGKVEAPQARKMNLLEERDDIEEANGPAYGFGH